MHKIRNAKIRFHLGSASRHRDGPDGRASNGRTATSLVPGLLHVTHTPRRSRAELGPRAATPVRQSGEEGRPRIWPTLDPGPAVVLDALSLRAPCKSDEPAHDAERSSIDAVDFARQSAHERDEFVRRRAGDIGRADPWGRIAATKALVALLVSPSVDAVQRLEIARHPAMVAGGCAPLLHVARRLVPRIDSADAAQGQAALASFLALHMECLASGSIAARQRSIQDLGTVLDDRDVSDVTKAAIRAQLAQAGQEGGLSLSDREALAGIAEVPMPGGWQDWVRAQKVQTNRDLSPPVGGPRPLHEAEIPFAGYLAANHLTGQETSDDHLDELHRMNGAALETRVNMDRGNVARDMQRTGNRVTRLAMAGTALIEEHRLAGIRDPGFMAPPFAAGQQTGVARHVRAGLCDENGLDTAVTMGGNLKPGDVVRAVRHKKFPHVVAQLNGRTTGDAWAEGSAMKSVHHRLTRSQDPSDYKELVVLDTVTGPKAIDKREQVIQRLGDDPKVANFVEEETRDDLPLSIEERFVYQDLNFVDADFAAEAREAVLQAPAAPKPSLMADHLERTVENAHPEIGEDWRMQRTSLFRELGTVDELARGDRWTKPSIAGNLGKVLDHAADLKRKPQNFPVRETGWPPRAPLAPAEPAERRDGDAGPGEAGPPSR